MKDALIYALGNVAFFVLPFALAIVFQFFKIVGGLIAERWRNS